MLYKKEIQNILKSDNTIFIYLSGSHYETLSRNGQGAKFEDYLQYISKENILQGIKDLNMRLKNNKKNVIEEPKIIKEVPVPKTNFIPKNNNPKKEIKIIDLVKIKKTKIIKAEDLDRFADAKIQIIGYDEKFEEIKIACSGSDEKNIEVKLSVENNLTDIQKENLSKLKELKDINGKNVVDFILSNRKSLGIDIKIDEKPITTEDDLSPLGNKAI